MPLKKHFALIFFTLVSFLLIVIHFNILSADPLLVYDDSYVVVPLKKVQSVNDYISFFKSHKIYDIQPVRDFSFWLDFQVQKISPIGVHHIHNFVIWLGILYLLFRMMLFFEVPYILNGCMVFLYAFHPALTNALVWVTARKHLLSTLFILWATLIFLQQGIHHFRKKDPWIITLLYLLACLSQPINILWPAWVALFLFLKPQSIVEQFKDKRTLLLLGLLSVVFIFTASVNQYYYTKVFVDQAENLKYVSSESNQLSFRLLLLGRSFWQALLPFWSTPLYYYPGSILNILGIGLFSSLLWWVIARKNLANRSWFFFALLPLLVITVNLTVVFGSDTYLLNTVVGLYLIIALFLKDHWKLFEKKIYRQLLILSFVAISISFIYQAKSVSESWHSDLAQTSRAVQVEPSPVALAFHIQNLMRGEDYANAFAFSQVLMDWDPGFRSVAQLYSSSLYKNSKINTETKKNLLMEKLKMYPDSPWIKYFLASLFAGEKKFNEAAGLMETIAAKDFSQYKKESTLVAADFYYFYYKSKKDISLFNYKIMEIKSALGEGWNQHDYDARISKFPKP